MNLNQEFKLPQSLFLTLNGKDLFYYIQGYIFRSFLHLNVEEDYNYLFPTFLNKLTTFINSFLKFILYLNLNKPEN